MFSVGHPAGCWVVKRWRYRLYSIARKLVRSGRQARLVISKHAPGAVLFTLIGEHCKKLQHRWRQEELAA